MKTIFSRLILMFALVVGAGIGGGVLAPHPAVAQTAAEAPDYELWAKTATRAEEAIAAGRASTLALEQLRGELTEWRQFFLGAQTANRNVIATVQRQLDALGPLPEDGVEAEDIAAQRQTLTARLAELQAPGKTAELAYSRAEGLIRGIDGIIRERQAEELLEFSPSPINPTHWPGAIAALTTTVSNIRGEFVNAWSNPVQQAETKEDMPAVVVLALLGIVLVLRGRRWSRRTSNRVLTDNPGPGRWIAGFAVSLGSMVLPYLGIFALTEAVYSTGLVGLRGDVLLSAILPSAFVFLMARWLATRIFPAREARTLPLNLEPAQRYTGRWYGASLGLVMAAYLLLKKVSDFAGWSEAANNSLLFPLMLLAGLLLLRLSGLLLTHSRAEMAEGGEASYRTRITRLLALALSLVAVLSPVMAVVGYFALAQFLLLPSLASLLLLAALLVLQRLVVEVYVLVSRNREGAADSLIPILIGFMLVVMSLPLFALAWGARVADLTELWTRLMEGVDLGGTRLSPHAFMTFAIIFVIGYMATRLVQGALKNTVLPKTSMDAGGRNAIVSGTGYVGIFLAAVVAITGAGFDLSSIAIVAGALSVGIGFGLQNVVSNFVSGIILLIERPISEGDWIEVGGVHGTVRDISVRSTIIQTFDRSDVIVPNSDLVSGRVTNYTRGNTVGRVIVPVGVAYGSDTRKVEKILREVAEAHPMVLANPAPAVIFRNFGASSLDFEIRAILRDVNWVLSVHSDMNHEIARRFEEEAIEVPFAQRDIWIRNPEALAGTPVAPEATTQDQGPPSDRVRIIEDDMPEAGEDGDGAGDGGER